MTLPQRSVKFPPPPPLPTTTTQTHPPTPHRWRDNPQYVLTPSCYGAFTLKLTQLHLTSGATPQPIGLILVSGKAGAVGLNRRACIACLLCWQHPRRCVACPQTPPVATPSPPPGLPCRLHHFSTDRRESHACRKAHTTGQSSRTAASHNPLGRLARQKNKAVGTRRGSP